MMLPSHRRERNTLCHRVMPREARAVILSVCASRGLKRELIRSLVGGSSQGRLGSFGIPSWTGNEPISRNPGGVPILDSCTAHGAFKAADLARLCNVLAAVINRAAFTGPVTRL